jgi:hypothetical protein
MLGVGLFGVWVRFENKVMVKVVAELGSHLYYIVFGVFWKYCKICRGLIA